MPVEPSDPTAGYPTPDLADVAIGDVLRALADPARMQILRMLADGLPHAKTPEVWGLELTKSTMSHHFKTLREAGLTETRIEGRLHSVRLRRSELDERFPGLIAAVLDSA